MDVRELYERDRLDYAERGKRVRFRVPIFFPWDPERRLLFAGEKVYVHGPDGLL